MAVNTQQIESLKFILENALQPERLNDHPWVHSLIAGEVKSNDISLGQRLVMAISRLFVESRPSVPPRQGKRLDTRWGEFGLLAAQYFAPLRYGAPVPGSLREAWGRIDAAILLFVYDKPADALAPAERNAYKLVADEPEIAPHSTLSDWHRKGLQRLLEAILAHEAYLAKSLSLPAVICPDGRELLQPTASSRPLKKRRPPVWRWLAFMLFLLLAGLLTVAGLEARRIYGQAMQLQQDVAVLQNILASSANKLELARQAGPALATVRADFLVLKGEVEPYLWMGAWLAWVPEYGGELQASQELVAYADALLAAGDISAESLAPFLEKGALDDLTPARLVELLNQAGPGLLEARQELEQAAAARARLRPEAFSPRVSSLLVNELDPLVALMSDGLTLAIEMPRAMGASSEGPKTYLLLAQNEDELRPTGGFITAAGVILVQDGSIVNPVFKNSGYLEDWNRPYPAAPWQLFHYMNSPVLIFRDTTWFTNYPTTALYAEQLYSYVSAHSVDGVIAFDQHFLVQLLRATGPILLPGEAIPVSADNVITYMRAAKQPSAEDLTNPEWENKNFLNEIASVLLDKLLSGEVGWEKLSDAMLAALNERNLLVQVDNPVLADYLARQGWDGAVRPGDADFLMVADANIGYNKTSVLVETSLDYEVDLRSLIAPSATLSIRHLNTAPEMFTCSQWGKSGTKDENNYPVNDCYWTYTRVYKPQNTGLIDSLAQFIPANWMLNYRSVPPQVDILDDEEIEGVQAFGTLKVIPGGQSQTSMMRFSLPLSVVQLQPESGLLAYRLRVQKQPGTGAIPLEIRVHLPPGAAVYHVPDEAVIEGDTIVYAAGLRIDLQFDVFFYAP